MKNYYIEGGIDFYGELYKSLDIEENINKIEEDNNVCLITNQPLTDKFVQMNCGHKFNYKALYKDLVNHKSKFNSFESTSGRLNNNEIRCPYCRAKQVGILPYYEELGLPQISGINYINPNNNNQSHNYKYPSCEYLTLNTVYDPSGNNPVETDVQNNGNCKYLKCFYTGSKIVGSELTEELIEYMQNKCYCWKHKKLLYKQFKKGQTDKIKEENKKLKLQEKANIKKAKEEEKLKLKEEQLKVKAELKKSVMLAKLNKKQINTEDENTIISSNINILTGNNNDNNNDNNCETKINTGCSSLLKSGTKKGTYCGCKVFNDNLCKRHYNLLTKENIVN